MSRTKKKQQSEPAYIRAGIRDNLVKIHIKTGVDLDVLRSLNPDIKNIISAILPGKNVRTA